MAVLSSRILLRVNWKEGQRFETALYWNIFPYIKSEVRGNSVTQDFYRPQTNESHIGWRCVETGLFIYFIIIINLRHQAIQKITKLNLGDPWNIFCHQTVQVHSMFTLTFTFSGATRRIGFWTFELHCISFFSLSLSLQHDWQEGWTLGLDVYQVQQSFRQRDIDLICG